MTIIRKETTLQVFDNIPTINGLGLEPVIALRDVKEIIKAVPEVDAVPLDKLCEFLADTLHTPAPCFNNEEICPCMDFGYCRLPGAPDVKECWKKILTKWMEG